MYLLAMKNMSIKLTHQRRSKRKAGATVATIGIQLVTAILQCNIYVMFLWDQYKHARVDNSREGINITIIISLGTRYIP